MVQANLMLCRYTISAIRREIKGPNGLAYFAYRSQDRMPTRFNGRLATEFMLAEIILRRQRQLPQLERSTAAAP